MGSALVVAVVKYGLLGLLWLFIIATVRTMRADLSGRTASTAPPTVSKTAKAPRATKKKGVGGRLVVTEGALQGTTVTLGTTPVTLGRAHDSTLVLTDDYASNKHARLYPAGEDWMLEDLGSTNGTWLGANKVTRAVVVPLGVPIRIGKTAIELRP
jgi:hypothetical protein